MSTRSVVSAVLLITLGIIFGVVLVSSFKGVDLTFAGENVKLGTQDPPVKNNAALKAHNDAYHEIARVVTPSVVYITVESAPASSDDAQGDGQRFFHFFGPDFKFNMPKRMPEVGAGSGVILTTNGYILTNNHVVENAKKEGIKVRLLDTREFKATLIGTDKYTDLAVIRIEADDLTRASLGNSDEVEVGHQVFAFGNPLGLTSTMTQGIVSALGRQIRIIDDENTGYGIENFIQTDAAVNPGNSGGALVDISGQVIGINTAIATNNARFQGYSFAIPINLAKKVAEDLIKFGKVHRGYIGVRIEAVDAVTARASGLDKAKGVMVRDVTKGSAGADAGLEVGDIILTVDEREVNTPNALQTIVAGHSPGESVTLKVWRDRKTIEKKVSLKSREEEETVAESKRPASEGRGKEDKPADTRLKVQELGLTVKSLDAKARKTYDVEKGVLVDDVEAMGPAQERGLVAGEVILSVGEKPVGSPEQFASVVKDLKPGDAVMLRVKAQDKKVHFVAIEMPK